MIWRTHFPVTTQWNQPSWPVILICRTRLEPRGHGLFHGNRLALAGLVLLRIPVEQRRFLAWNAIAGPRQSAQRSEEHTSELQSLRHLVCRLLLEKQYTASSALR